MIMGVPMVTSLKKARSSGMCQGRALSRPITRFSAIATTNSTLTSTLLAIVLPNRPACPE